jgi:nitrite reductase/ring-hydroxylating ferredoxin subunit
MTPVDDVEPMVSAWSADLEQGTVPFRALHDPEIYAAELQRIFGRAWLALGLESEVAEGGDFVVRTMGEDEVIVSRDDDGAIHVLLNNCRHRGTWLCREEKGNTRTFRCPYHGWVYRNDGSWAGAPMKARAYRTLKPEEWGLLRAPKVETRWGVIFATLDPDAPSLDDYLGEFAFHADAFMDVDSRGYRLLSDPSRWRAHSNWKSNPENVTGDAYHVAYLHESAVEVGVVPPVAPIQDHFTMFNVGNGHGLLAWNLHDAGMLPPGSNPWGYPSRVWDQFDKAGLTGAQLKFIGEFTPLTMMIFPNLTFTRLITPDPATGEPLLWTWMRVVQPHGPSEHISWNWFMNFAAEPEAHSPIALRAGLQWLGPAGIGDIDDALSWEGAAKAGGSVFAQSQNMQMNYLMGVGDMSTASDVPGWDGPGAARKTAYNEDNQREFYTEWLKRLGGA